MGELFFLLLHIPVSFQNVAIPLLTSHSGMLLIPPMKVIVSNIISQIEEWNIQMHGLGSF